jgi:hypothetical protein
MSNSSWGTPSGSLLGAPQSGSYQGWGTTQPAVPVNSNGGLAPQGGQVGLNQSEDNYLNSLNEGGQSNTQTNANGLAGGMGLADNFLAQQAPAAGAQWNGPSQGYLASGANAYGQQEAGQAGALQGVQGQQQAYLQQVQQMGASNSAAQAQLQQGLNASNSAAMSTARSQGGTPAQQAAALRNAQNVQAQNAGSAGAQSAQLQAQQQQQAAALQGQMLNNMAGQSINQQQLAAQQQQGYLNSGIAAGGQDLNAQISNNQVNSGNYNAAQALNQNTSTANTQANMAALSGIASMAAGASGGAAMSDVGAKTDITPASDSSADSLASIFGGADNLEQASDNETSQLAQGGWSPGAQPAPYQATYNLSMSGGGKPSSSGGGSMSSMMGGGSSASGSAGAGAGAGGTAAAGTGADAGASVMSDYRDKAGVRSASPGAPSGGDADRFLASLKPFTFRYKDPEDEPSAEPHGGRYLGIMAQNVEKGPTGDTLVIDTPRGKAIEEKPGLSAALAGIGRLHERLSALEAQKARA